MNTKQGKGFFKKSLALLLTAATAFSVVGCKNDDTNNSSSSGAASTTTYNNENDPLVFSSAEVDKVFNPFFSTTAADSNVVNLTQIGMLSNDSNGKVAYGDDEAVVTKDLQIVTKGTENVDQTTTYYFVLKNNVKFSNGSALTIKDVLFNLYVYLDPAYTGSSTIYSTDIVGLKEYRTQASSEKEQDSFKQQFEVVAESRIQALVSACEDILDNHGNEANLDAKFKEYLAGYTSIGDSYKNVVKDYEKALELFSEELESDYSNSVDSYKDMVFTDEAGKVHKDLFTTDVEVFLYNEGYITWSKKDGKLFSSLVNDPKTLKTWTKENAIATVLADKIPTSIAEVLQYWNTAVTLNTYLVNEAMENYFQDSSKRVYTNISGIQFANRTGKVTVNGTEYDTPVYNDDGSVKSGNEVLSITINDVDPKAIWNFSFAVAPMYYYSDAAHIEAFDFVSNFGVEYGSQTFMNEVVKDPTKIGVPVGAGAYAASKSSGGITGVSAGEFYSLGVIYFERNPYFVLGTPKIKKVRYQVVASAQMLNSLYNQEIDFAEPNAKPETITELNGKKSEGLANKSVQTSGYGYIGVNAGKVPDLKVRQAIMHSINTQECVDYYKTTAQAIYRSMSLSSWAYPKNSTSYYPYIGGAVPEDLSVVNPDYADYVTSLGKKAGDKLTEQEQEDFIRGLVEEAGYSENGNGVYQKGSNVLKYTFTIAGEETDHPAWDAMYHAGELLNRMGFQIYVTTDSNALKKLSSGDLTVWAAAWGSTIDPDMYQVYHKDSNATSVLNWGYKQILLNVGGKYDTEVALVDELSDYIDQARKTNDETKRARIYSKALDIVMQLAIELPTYQRDDLFAYNANKIDETTLTPESELSSFMGLTTDLWNVSLKVA